MKHILLACGLLLGGSAALQAQSTEPTKGFKPNEKNEVAEAGRLNKTKGQQELNASYQNENGEKKLKKKDCCKGKKACKKDRNKTKS